MRKQRRRSASTDRRLIIHIYRIFSTDRRLIIHIYRKFTMDRYLSIDTPFECTREYNHTIVDTCNLSHLVGKPTMWFPTRSDTNQPVLSQKRARILKFRILVEEELYYPSSENKGADQLRGYREADLICAFVSAYADCWFFHGAAH